ncbi:hypothetical protein BDY19DRAFT_988579 [Irpex rosettiformis]|uniref:Uncharacterized protein n=1 Tax=Irpex rosettiformis TaxID=378272 RepID=A0ACB8UK11_9APHY|nr:hypothetical protein BDY19DRAFT_988579 [Irpex rosettiformis]
MHLRRMPTSAEHDEDPGMPTHKARHSLVTNASGLAESTITFGSIMSNDGFARLSQFPSVPPMDSLSPVEEGSILDSPIRSEASLGSLGLPMTSRRTLPTPPVAESSTSPLDIRGLGRQPPTRVRSPPQDTPLEFPYFPPSATTSPSVPGLAHSPTTVASYPSPHDWHDGSSSIASDPYGTAALPTSFITSLLSSSTNGDTGSFAPSAFFNKKGGAYEPSVISNALTTVTTDSTITYPPPKLYPPPLPGSPRSRPPVPPLPSNPIEPITMPPSSFSIEGRQTPDTLRTNESEGASTMRHQGSAISQTVGGMRAMSTTPSLQSLNSSAPLMHQTFSHVQVDPILEEDEFRPPSGPSTPAKSRSSRGHRASTAYSSKSTKSYMSSLVARLSHSSGSGERKSIKQSAVSWFRGKPLPPVPPLPNVPIQQIRKAEEQLALPELAGRAQALSAMLDKGQRPYDSDGILNQQHQYDSRYKEYFSATGVDVRTGPSTGDVYNSSVNPNMMRSARDRRGRSEDFTTRNIPPQPESPTRPGRKFRWSALSKRQRIWLIVACVALIVIITVAAAVGATEGQKHHAQTCPTNLGGVLCNLDATCVCATQGSSQCKQLAQSIATLIPVMNTAFTTSYSADFVSDAIWQVQGISTESSCVNQVSLIDVAPALDSTTSPNRTQWTQAALLWNLVRSESISANQQMLDFVQNADWKSLSSSDGPTDDTSLKFALTVTGYNFDFAAQIVTVPTSTFVDKGQPSNGQLGRVNDIAHGALDRMYSFAIASSTQQQSALQQYWTSELQKPASSLQSFVDTITGSPVLLPFDSSTKFGSTSLVPLISKPSTPVPFPPPLACYPSLTAPQLQLVNNLESTIFGLTTAPGASAFDTSCFPNRPVYGVLDVLELRLPFSDARDGVAKQAIVLTRDTISRVVVYSGEVASALPGSGSSGSLSTDPRDYGVLKNMNHVILKYLRSLDHSTASALVDFVLNPQAVPPTPSSSIYSALSNLPLLEVAVFGTIDPADVNFVASSLSDSQGGLYFGTQSSSVVRNWTIEALQKHVTWTENATAPLVVQDSSNSNPSFNEIWAAAVASIQTGSDTNATLARILKSFNDTELLHPQS